MKNLRNKERNNGSAFRRKRAWNCGVNGAQQFHKVFLDFCLLFIKKKYEIKHNILFQFPLCLQELVSFFLS